MNIYRGEIGRKKVRCRSVHFYTLNGHIDTYMVLAKSFSSLVVINAIRAPLLAAEQDPPGTP